MFFAARIRVADRVKMDYEALTDSGSTFIEIAVFNISPATGKITFDAFKAPIKLLIYQIEKT